MTEWEILDGLVARYPCLAPLRETIRAAHNLISGCYAVGGKLLICGNGGSCADAGHMVGELMKGFLLPRPLPAGEREALLAAGGGALASRLQCGLPAVSLAAHQELVSAVANDLGAELAYAQQVQALGRPGDVLVGLSTSGNAENVANAALVARARGLTVIGLTGADGGRLRELADVLIAVPAKETYQVQELHLPVYHAQCAMAEQAAFGAGTTR